MLMNMLKLGNGFIIDTKETNMGMYSIDENPTYLALENKIKLIEKIVNSEASDKNKIDEIRKVITQERRY